MSLQRSSWPVIFLTLMMFYACVQYMTGEKGYFSQASRKQDIADMSVKLANMKIEREELTARARYLSNDQLSDDLLEERARVLLGLGNPHIYVLHDPQLRQNLKTEIGIKSHPNNIVTNGSRQPKA